MNSLNDHHELPAPPAPPAQPQNGGDDFDTETKITQTRGLIAVVALLSVFSLIVGLTALFVAAGDDSDRAASVDPEIELAIDLFIVEDGIQTPDSSSIPFEDTEFDGTGTNDIVNDPEFIEGVNAGVTECYSMGNLDAFNGELNTPSWDWTEREAWDLYTRGHVVGCEAGYLAGYEFYVNTGIVIDQLANDYGYLDDYSAGYDEGIWRADEDFMSGIGPSFLLPALSEWDRGLNDGYIEQWFSLTGEVLQSPDFGNDDVFNNYSLGWSDGYDAGYIDGQMGVFYEPFIGEFMSDYDSGFADGYYEGHSDGSLLFDGNAGYDECQFNGGIGCIDSCYYEVGGKCIDQNGFTERQRGCIDGFNAGEMDALYHEDTVTSEAEPELIENPITNYDYEFNRCYSNGYNGGEPPAYEPFDFVACDSGRWDGELAGSEDAFVGIYEPWSSSFKSDDYRDCWEDSYNASWLFNFSTLTYDSFTGESSPREFWCFENNDSSYGWPANVPFEVTLVMPTEVEHIHYAFSRAEDHFHLTPDADGRLEVNLSTIGINNEWLEFELDGHQNGFSSCEFEFVR